MSECWIEKDKKRSRTHTNFNHAVDFNFSCWFRNVINIIELTLFIRLTRKKEWKKRIHFHRQTDPNRNIQNIFEMKRKCNFSGNFQYPISLTTMSTPWHLSILEAKKRFFFKSFSNVPVFTIHFDWASLNLKLFSLSTQTKRVIIISVKLMCVYVCLFYKKKKRKIENRQLFHKL